MTYIKKSLRPLCALSLILGAALTLAACCDDYFPDCYSVVIELGQVGIPAGGSVEIFSGAGEHFVCDETPGVDCSRSRETVWLYDHRPEQLHIRMLDSAGVELAIYNVTPRYNSVRGESSCGGPCAEASAEVELRPHPH